MWQMKSHAFQKSQLTFAALAVMTVVVLLLGGCRATPTTKPATPSPATPRPGVGSLTDPCPERLHEIAGPLLLYYATYQRLPPTLAALREVAPEEMPPPICPISQQPYAYRPEGLQLPGVPGNVIVYQPKKDPSGIRWAIVLGAPSPSQPLVPQVLPIPESAFDKVANETPARGQERQ